MGLWKVIVVAVELRLWSLYMIMVMVIVARNHIHNDKDGHWPCVDQEIAFESKKHNNLKVFL